MFETLTAKENNDLWFALHRGIDKCLAAMVGKDLYEVSTYCLMVREFATMEGWLTDAQSIRWFGKPTSELDNPADEIPTD